MVNWEGEEILNNFLDKLNILFRENPGCCVALMFLIYGIVKVISETIYNILVLAVS